MEKRRAREKIPVRCCWNPLSTNRTWNVRNNLHLSRTSYLVCFYQQFSSDLFFLCFLHFSFVKELLFFLSARGEEGKYRGWWKGKRLRNVCTNVWISYFLTWFAHKFIMNLLWNETFHVCATMFFVCLLFYRSFSSPFQFSFPFQCLPVWVQWVALFCTRCSAN